MSKTENDMSDEELENFENLTKVVEDRLDRLEAVRKLLDESRLEQMNVLKKSQKLGPACPYYKKAKRLWELNEEKKVIQELRKILEEFTDV